jgi:AraC-like DNA-binding protein
MATESGKILSAAATGLNSFLAHRGICPDEVVGGSRIDPEQLGSGTASVDLSQFCAVLERAAAVSGDQDIGLDYGLQFTPEKLGLIGYVALVSPTLMLAVENLARYFRFHQQSTVVKLTYEHPFHRLSYRIATPLIREKNQDALLTLGLFWNVFRVAVGSSWVPDIVHVEQSYTGNKASIEKAFGAPVVFDQPTNAICFRPQSAVAKMPKADLRLLDILTASLVQLGLSGQTRSLVEQMRSVVRQNLGTGTFDLDALSRALSVPCWTIKRRLADENMSFSDLVDQVRRETAQQYIGSRDIGIGQLALMLGYSEVSAFSRAFRRWHNVSPVHYRSLILS